MKFAMFYEIPVPKPWTPDQEHQAYKNTIEQVKLGDRHGLPLVLDGRAPLPRRVLALLEPRGAVRAHRRRSPRTSASATACACCRSRTTTRSAPPRASRCSTSSATVASSSAPAARRRAPRSRASASTRTRRARCGTKRCATSSAAGRNDEYEFEGKHWSMPQRRVHPKPLQEPHPPIWGATSSVEGHYEIGKRGIGLLSFTVGNPPEQLEERIAELPQGAGRLHEAGRQVPQRDRGDVHDGALRRHQREGARRRRGVVRLVPEDRGLAASRSLAEYMEERGQELGNYDVRGRGAQGQAVAAASTTSHGLPLRQRAPASSATPTAASRSASATRRSAASCCSAC